MTEFILGINNCFALGRYPEPEEWLNIVRNLLGLVHVQFSFDAMDPVIVDFDVVRAKCLHLKSLADSMGVVFDTAITGEVPHKSNALLDPDPAVRGSYLRWYERMIRAASFLEAEGSGVYLGTMSQKDNADPRRREFMIEALMEEISHLTLIAKEEGQRYFLWEPMSIPREIPSTIRETKELLARVNESAHIPVQLCLDVGHGWIHSTDPRDRDPYAWLKELAHVSPTIHLQQTDGQGSRHWPFTAEYNAKGIIVPEKVFEAVEAAGAKKTILVFEFFYSAHAASEDGALDSLKSTVEYWQESLARAYR